MGTGKPMADVESTEDDDPNTGQIEAAANPAKRIAIFVVVLLLALVVLRCVLCCASGRAVGCTNGLAWRSA